MNQIELAFKGAWSVLWVGLTFGAGLPVVFALAVRCLAIGADEPGPDGTTTFRPSPIGRVLAGVLLLILVLAVALGITLIVASGFGKSIQFDSLVPSLVDKK